MQNTSALLTGPFPALPGGVPGQVCFPGIFECIAQVLELLIGEIGDGVSAIQGFPVRSHQLHFPGLDPKAAEWLVTQRRPKAIGLDTPSIDTGQSTLFRSHVILFEHNVPAFENVANLEQLPEKGFTVIALPMKIRGGSGGPLRIIAIVQ